MGIVIRFPAGERAPRSNVMDQSPTPGEVVILPVIRIERYLDQPADNRETGRGSQASRKRRRRALRS